jgi:PAS domain-containing protein
MQDTSFSDSGQQIVVGQYIYQSGHAQGGLVQPVMAVLPAAVPQPVTTPVTIRPRPSPQLIGRHTEVAWVTELLQQQISAEFYSEPGMGKTALLRHLAYHPVTDQFPDGVLYLVANQEPAEDLLHALYTAFYQSTLPHKPTENELRDSMQAKNALVILDDFDLGQDGLNRLRNSVPLCTFLLASSGRFLGGDGEARALFGLPPGDALALVEAQWGRPLNEEERATAQSICAALKGHPLRIQQTIMAAREQDLSLPDVAGQIEEKPSVERISLSHLHQQLTAAFDESELQDLCLDLGLDYESLHAQGKANKAWELLEMMARHGRLSNLIAHCAQVHPHLNWGEPTQAVVDNSVKALPVEKREILSVLAAFGDRPLSAELISQLVGQTDVSSLLAELMQGGLVQNSQYHLAGSLPHRFQSDLEPMLLYLVEWAAQQAAQHAQAVLAREAKTLAFLQQWAATNDHPAEAYQLGRLLDRVLAIDGRWGLWQQALLVAQQAAQSMADQAAEAWALNQLGCRALCLGDRGVARIQLERAKGLNEAVGNEAGTAVNEHNLGILDGALTRRSGWRRVAPFMAAGIVLLILLGWWWSRTAVIPPLPPTATATATSITIVTEPPLPTATALLTAATEPPPTSTPDPTDTVMPSATVVIETAVATPTPSAAATLSSTATHTPTRTATPSATPTPTSTPTPTLTPSPTNTRWPTPLPTFTPGPVTQPTLIIPEQGTTHRTGLTFQWRGNLQPGQQYRVQLRHTDSGFTLTSPLLTEPVWMTILPAERFGEWYWEVAVISNNIIRAVSDNWHFYLDPFPPPTLPPSATHTPTPPSPTETPTIVVTPPVPGLA